MQASSQAVEDAQCQVEPRETICVSLSLACFYEPAYTLSSGILLWI